jgi:thymidylate synthase (FAD)
MSVTFVHCTPEAEKLIVRMARVSSPQNADNWETGPRLLRYLLEHRHFSPFEMASMCVKIETERDIATQILRHRSFSFQETSSRYTPMPPAEIPALRQQAVINRQSSTDELDPEVAKHFERLSAALIKNIHLTYQEMLTAGVARECARRILPLCTPTTLYMHATIRSWIHYIQLRTKSDTQLEHRLVAEACREIFTEQFPTIAAAAFAP